MLTSRSLIVVATMIALTACQSDTDSPIDRTPRDPASISADGIQPHLSSMTPYPASTKVASPKAPAGFEPVFAQNVARHGSRALTNGELLKDTLDLWEDAERADALTDAGERFGPEARALYTAMKKVGFGMLNTLGEEEMAAIGAREGRRLDAMFEAGIADGARVDVLDSGVPRAKKSAVFFSRGLASAQPDLEIERTKSDENLLKYSGENEAYEDFLDGDDWKPSYNAVRKLSGIDQEATDALEHLFDEDFVAGIRNKLYYANGIYDAYRAGPAMNRDINVDTRPLMPESAAKAFAYVEDGRYFYLRGPGLEGDDRSYQAAQILLDDFFDEIDDHLKDRDKHPYAAVYRFAHAEEITPFAALIALPGADEPGVPGETYTHENNEFRVSRIAQLSSNIGWTVWSDGDTNIVSVAHNERPTTVGRDCQPYEGTQNFYELEELRSCLGAS